MTVVNITNYNHSFDRINLNIKHSINSQNISLHFPELFEALEKKEALNLQLNAIRLTHL